MQSVLLIIFSYFLIDQCKFFVIIFSISMTILHLALANIHRENLTITRGEQVKLNCPFPRNYSSKENILQWKRSRLDDDDDNLIIGINGKIPKTLEHVYRTELNNQSSSLELLHVEKGDSTSYICQTFETQTILCQYNLVVLSKYYERIIIISSCSFYIKVMPEAPVLTINKENIEEYQAVTLTCSSLNGNPPPQYTWYRNHTRLTYDDRLFFRTILLPIPVH